MQGNNKSFIILHIPHSSLTIPQEALCQFNTELLKEEQLLMTDRFTDELFDLPFSSIVFPYSRIFCDVERFRDDEKEEMSKKGMGVVYTRTHDGVSYRNVSVKEKNEILENYYDLHHHNFESLEKLKKFNKALIIDCHSFNPYPLPHEFDKSNRPDICIGVDHFHTDKTILEYLKIQFGNKNYTVKINSPFSGSIVPICFYGKDKNVSSVMIELNRKLYMNMNGEKNESFSKLKNDIKDIILGLEEKIVWNQSVYKTM